MRILFASTGGVGHLQPLLPYARALRERGHEIRIAARDTLTERIAKNGFAHVVLPTADDTVMQPLRKQSNALPHKESLAFFMDRVFAGVVLEAALPTTRASVEDWKPELVVRDSAEFASLVAAEAADLPHVRVECNNAETHEFMMPFVIPAGDRARVGAGLAADAGASVHAEPDFTSFPAAFDGHVARVAEPAFRIGPTPSLAPARSTASPDWLPPGDEPLIYVTFGTVAQQMDVAGHIHCTALEAVDGLPVRVLMTTGAALDPEALGPIPDNTRVEVFVPQAEVFPLAAAVVHHGGSGTLLGALAAGLPMVVTPLFADQPENAVLAARRLAGSASGTARPKPLRATILDLLDDGSSGEALRAVAAEMAALPGVTEAAIAIEGRAGAV